MRLWVRRMSILKIARGSARDGFTLIELMAAMVIMAVGVFSVIQMQLISIRGNSYARERSGAQEIANGVAEELMTQSLRWVQPRNGAAPAFEAVFQAPGVTILRDTNPPPMGTQIPFSILQAITVYNGNIIAPGLAAAGAQLINTAGCTAPPPACSGVIYRVHYFAQSVFRQRGAAQPDQDLVRITIFVSWDNKDFGAPIDYAGFNWLTNFWSRHMVTATIFVSPTQLF
jgi:prepilin-type N-terminal cleavage/methylation domain-containing protein